MRVTDGTLTIRNAMGDDAEQLCAWWNDGQVMAHAGFPNGLNEQPENARRRTIKDTDDCRLCIIERDGQPIGEMSYRAVGDGKTAEIGIKICDVSAQGHGHGTALMRMFMDSLFRDYGFTRIALNANANNARARHFYQKLGFRQTAERVNAWQDQLGAWQTAVDYEYP